MNVKPVEPKSHRAELREAQSPGARWHDRLQKRLPGSRVVDEGGRAGARRQLPDAVRLLHGNIRRSNQGRSTRV